MRGNAISNENALEQAVERDDHARVRLWIGERLQGEAATALGVSQGFLSLYLGGRRELSNAQIHRWEGITAIPSTVFLTAKFEAARST